MRIQHYISALAILAAFACVRADERPELAIGRNGLYDYDPPQPGSYQLPPLKPATDGRVLDSHGKEHKLKSLLDGRVTVLSFIYTRCNDPKACPHATGVLYRLHQVSLKDSVIAKNLQLISFSFDPTHDTPAVMDSYSDRFDRASGGANWMFLTTRTPADIAPILRGYGQVVDRKANPNDVYGPYNHTLRVYLIDRNGMVRNIYSYGLFDARLVMTDVRTLLMEEPGRLAKRESR
jgi:protein SCO1/2